MVGEGEKKGKKKKGALRRRPEGKEVVEKATVLFFRLSRFLKIHFQDKENNGSEEHHRQ